MELYQGTERWDDFAEVIECEEENFRLDFYRPTQIVNDYRETEETYTMYYSTGYGLHLYPEEQILIQDRGDSFRGRTTEQRLEVEIIFLAFPEVPVQWGDILMQPGKEARWRVIGIRNMMSHLELMCQAVIAREVPYNKFAATAVDLEVR